MGEGRDVHGRHGARQENGRAPAAQMRVARIRETTEAQTRARRHADAWRTRIATRVTGEAPRRAAENARRESSP